MTQVVNNDKLTFVFTQWGLNRIAEALSDPLEDIYLTKVKLGSGDSDEYYTPDNLQEDLKGPIPDSEFYIIEKALLEDELTTSFKIVIPETFGGCDIREVGIYETYHGEDHLFAISTQQPFVKPTVEDNYLISIDYYLFLKAQNLASIYEQIKIDPDHELVTKQNFEDLMSTMLFVQGNLADQIAHNSQIIGFDRAAQLQEKITENRTNFGYYATYKNYIDLINVTEPEKVFGYWVFNYPRRTAAKASIIDIGVNKNNMSTNKQINMYPRKYSGIMSTLSFTEPNYYYLSPSIQLSFLDETGSEDVDFFILFALKPLTEGENRALLARSNYATGIHAFEIKETATGRVQVKLFADENNYILYETEEGIVPNTAHSIALAYKKEDHSLVIFVSGDKVNVSKTIVGTYEHMSSTPTTLYAFVATPEETIYADSASAPMLLKTSTGAPYEGTDWTISNNGVFYKGTLVAHDSSKNIQTDTLYAWEDQASRANVVYTKSLTIEADTVLYNADYTVYEESQTGFYKALVGEDEYAILFAGVSTVRGADISPETLYAYYWSAPSETIWSDKDTDLVALYNSDGSFYAGTRWSIIDGEAYYDEKYLSSRDSSQDQVKPILGVYPYIIAQDGSNIDYVNSEVGVISIVKDTIDEEDLKVLAIGLEATLGSNPCIKTY